MYNINTLNHKLLTPFLGKDKIAIDGTSGNGNDTEFFCRNCNFVYAFDIQEEAKNNTLKRLNSFQNFQFILDSHSNLDHYINTKVDAVTFNFGYLPNSNSKIITTSSTSIPAILKAYNLLNDNGVMTLCVYYMHENGAKECNDIINYVINNFSYYNMMQTKENGPILIQVTKQKENML